MELYQRWQTKCTFRLVLDKTLITEKTGFLGIENNNSIDLIVSLRINII